METVVVAPMPIASESAAVSVKTGLRRSSRPRVPQVPLQVVEPHELTGVTMPLLGALDAAKREPGRASRLVSGQPAPPVFVLQQQESVATRESRSASSRPGRIR